MDIAQLQKQAGEYLQGQYSDAIALYQQCIDIDPTLMSNYWHLGLALLLKGEELEAQAVWLSALTQETDVGLAELLKILNAEAIRHLHPGGMYLAEKIYWQILELDSNQPEAYYNLGSAIAHRGDFDRAVACWQRAIELKPDFADAYQNQGFVFQKQDKFEAAIPCYLKALEIQPDWTETYYNLGICFSQQGKLDQAIACFQQAIQLKPDYIQAYGDLGSTLLEQGKLDQAIACFQQAIQLKPAFAQIYCSWNALANQGKSNDTSNACFLKALQIQSGTVDIYLYLGKYLLREKKFDLAVAFYKKVLCIHPDSDEIYLYLGQALVQQGNLPEAIASYQKALLIYPSTEVYLYLGNALGKGGKLVEAIASYRKALLIDSNSAEVYLNLGIALAQQDNSDEAIACFQKVIEINSNLAKLIYDVMMAFCEQGKLDATTICFQKALPVEPPNQFYESTWDWIITHNLATSNYLNIYPKNQIYLTPPRTPDKTIHFAFRFGNQVELPAAFVAIVPDGRYWLAQSQAETAIITSDHKLLADVSPDFPVLSPGHPDKHPSRHSIFSLGKLPPVQSIDGTVAVLSGLLNDVYFHWMFDILPRIELLRCSGIEIACIDQFLINNRNLLPFHLETLNIFGIPETKIVKSNSPHIKAKRLVVPSFPGTIAWMPKWSCDFLRSEFLNQTANNKSEKIERIYISRKNATNRRIINEDEVLNFLNKFGFKSVTLEAMSVAEQVSLMANAEVVIAPHGSGLTNIVFCSPGTKVIEIFSPNYVYPCYWLVSNLVDLKYYYLLGEFAGFYLHKMLYPNPGSEDIFVNLDSLLKVMKFAEVEQT